MAEPKPLASLTSGLLARKGAAQPAMRRPTLGFTRTPLTASPDDLGWNDMGFDVEPIHEPTEELAAPIGLTPMAPVIPVPPVMVERQLLATRLARQLLSADAPVRGRKTAFTLRLDTGRHLKLRLACAITGRSAQQIVTQALDDLLNDLPEIDRLTEQLPPAGDGERMKGG
ncbi:hypothetical protein U5A82_10310 [Sphingobium sp. CR2-8]|uniref:hypothetical protein n=1 Tax=Sphingobium sp. CR2-8 TaxID=1306534 RepID=UPI002DB58A2E|nr:hypothetical protein [Sphingobium sp. CR2-8]MEC3910849.1 hypothetical protein [Sphingobium sp. CR2-8]